MESSPQPSKEALIDIYRRAVTIRKKAAMARMPIGRFGFLEELAGPLLLLASDASSYMAGSVVTVDAAHSVNILE